MYFAKTLLVCASLISSAVSQSRIAFTVLPSSIEAGKDVTLHWGGGDGSPVTLTLQQGTTSDLKTVELVAGDVTGDSYTWSVPKSLPDGTNYALRIQQGDTEPNYTGMITVTGGAPAGSSFSGSGSGSSVSGSASATASSSGSASASASASKSASSASLNSTASVTSKPTLVGTAKSAGTGTSIHRNTTLSHATLTATSASSTGSNTAVGGSGGSPTGSTSAPASTKTGGAIALVASNFALVVCAVAGIILLG